MATGSNSIIPLGENQRVNIYGKNGYTEGRSINVWGRDGNFTGTSTFQNKLCKQSHQAVNDHIGYENETEE
jgi:hypothetical protein